jgi:hypothetical protein
MKMQRHYFISDDLDDLDALEDELEHSGIMRPQIHVLSLDDTSVETHRHLHDVNSLMKKDLINSTAKGAAIGVVAAVLALAIPYYAGWTETAAGWIPFIFLSIVLLGFCTWEGGLVGIQKSNTNFKRFEDDLKAGKHVFFVDLEPGQETIVQEAVKRHASVKVAGTGPATPHWVVFSQYRLKRLFAETLP